jgi:hypothetical protein
MTTDKDSEKEKRVDEEHTSVKKAKSVAVSMDPFLMYARKKALGLLEDEDEKSKAI